MPVTRIPDFLPVEGELASLYNTLRDRYGIEPTQANELYRVGAVQDEEAGLLDVAPGTPAFLVRRTTFDAIGPFEYVQSTMRADRYEIRSKLFY